MNTNKIWFTSDNHFGHKNIIRFTNRPFSDVEEMNQEMINRWNEKVGKNDDVYHLGDFALASAGKTRQIRKQLNGRIHLIKGNHESSALECADCFEWIKDYYELKVNDRNGPKHIILFHYALKVWNASHHGAWHLYGHSHGSLRDDDTSRSFDVGVDNHNFYPLSYDEVKKIIMQKKWTPPFGPRDK